MVNKKGFGARKKKEKKENVGEERIRSKKGNGRSVCFSTLHRLRASSS